MRRSHLRVTVRRFKVDYHLEAVILLEDSATFIHLDNEIFGSSGPGLDQGVYRCTEVRAGQGWPGRVIRLLGFFTPTDSHRLKITILCRHHIA